MKQRIITALILAPLVLLGIIYLPLAWFMPALAVITLIGFWEWTQFVNAPQSRMLALIPALVVSGASVWWVQPTMSSLNDLTTRHYSILLIGTAWWVIASLLAITYPRSRPGWERCNSLRHCFGILTLLPFYWSIVFLRAEAMSVNMWHGAQLVIFVCLIVWTADSGAYFSGKFLGRHKMAPAVSPNKTLEGLAGGLILAVLVGTGLAKAFEIEFSSDLAMYFIIFCTAIISVLGDLVESMFKRVSNIKDSSHIIPGHGGVLDRIDSLTAAFPVFAFLYFIL